MSKMLASNDLAVKPSFFYETVSEDSDYNHFAAFPPQTTLQARFAPWTPYPDLQQSAADNRANYDCKSDQSLATIRTEAWNDSLEHQKRVKHRPWSQGTHREPARTSAYPTFPTSHGFPSDLDSSQMASMRSPFLPLPTDTSNRPPWDGSDVAHTMSEILVPRPRNSHVFAFDAGDTSGPALYSTASDLQPNFTFPMKRTYRDIDDTITVCSYETDNESLKGEPPYAKLIYNALMHAPEHKLVLREIYAWISENTDKAKDPAFKGWQNSVRHNLSMNGAFVKVPYIDPANKHKKGFIWVLNPAAVGKGIESTTRYRQKTINKRNDNHDLVDPKRQRSGRKGGRAAGKSAKLRRSVKMDDYDPRCAHYLPSPIPEYCHSPPISDCHSLSPNLNHYSLGAPPYYLDTPSSESPYPENSPYSHPDNTARTEVPADQGLFSSTFDNDSDFLGRRPEDLFDGQGVTAFL